MTDRTPPLTPYPLRVLLGRVAHEWETRHRIFDLPIARIFDVSDEEVRQMESGFDEFFNVTPEDRETIESEA